MTDTFLSINAIELSKLLAEQGKSIQLIDVRQPDEREICDIGGVLMPLPDFVACIPELDKHKLTVVYCRSGGRSATACRMLKAAGFEHVINLEQGILGWIEQVDGSLMSY